MSGKSRTSESSEDIISCSSCSHVLGDCLGCCGGGRRGGVARCALHHVDSITSLDLVCAKGLVILHDAPRVDQALPLSRNVFEVLPGKLRLELQDGRGLGYRDIVGLVARTLDLEGQGSATTAALGIVGHAAIAKARLRDGER